MRWIAVDAVIGCGAAMELWVFTAGSVYVHPAHGLAECRCIDAEPPGEAMDSRRFGEVTIGKEGAQPAAPWADHAEPVFAQGDGIADQIGRDARRGLVRRDHGAGELVVAD